MCYYDSQAPMHVAFIQESSFFLPDGSKCRIDVWKWKMIFLHFKGKMGENNNLIIEKSVELYFVKKALRTLHLIRML